MIVHVSPLDITKGEKNDPRKIAGHTRLFSDRLPEVDGEAQSHPSAVFRPPLSFAVHVSSCLFCRQGVSLPARVDISAVDGSDPIKILAASFFVLSY